MTAPRRSQAEYDRRMHAVIEYIDRHLDESLDVATLAAVAHFSAFHFHRLFRALTGEAARRLRAPAPARAGGDSPAFAGARPGSRNRARRRIRIRRSVHAGVPLALRLLAERMAKEQVRSGGPQGGSVPAPRATEEWRLSKKGALHESETRRSRAGARSPTCVTSVRYGPSLDKFWMRTVAPWMDS